MSRTTYLIFLGLWLFVCILVIGAFQTRAANTLPAQLTWSNPDTTDKIQVEKGPAAAGTFTTIAQLPALTTTYLDATNAPGDNNCFRVAYFNASGVGPYAGPVCKNFPALPTQTPGAFIVQ
jgi:hypothetical protein